MTKDYIPEAVEITDAIVDIIDTGGNKSQIIDTVAKLLARQQKLQQCNVSSRRELLIAFYAYLENNGKFPNTVGWGSFWADKYLESNQ